MESNIAERLHNARQSFERLRSNHSILKNLRDPALTPIFESFDFDAAQQKLIDQFKEFLQDTNAEIIPVEMASSGDVFEWYFDKRPPFGDGKKKSEFPDAFTISALENWCEQKQQLLYVVTSDQDLVKHCETSERLIRLARPAEFVDAFLKQNATFAALEESAWNHVEVISDAVIQEFEGLGFYLDDEEGDVNSVSFKKMSINDMYLLDIGSGIATFEMDATIRFSADITYDDMDTAIWDSEEKVSVPMRQIETEIERSGDFIATIRVRLDEQSKFLSVESVSFADGDAAIRAREDDHY